ncbi:MAG: hypothetical protein AVDCRST_MAG87-87, partial [uncultured Thermomicrobiales bacterium]
WQRTVGPSLNRHRCRLPGRLRPGTAIPVTRRIEDGTRTVPRSVKQTTPRMRLHPGCSTVQGGNAGTD